MPNVTRLLLVGDDRLLILALSEQFSVRGDYLAVTAADESEARARAKEGRYECAVFDAAQDGASPRTLYESLKADGFACPAVFLGDSGGGDTMAKPFRFAELLARVQTLLREREMGEAGRYEIGPYVFTPGAKTLDDGARRIHLTEKETNILKFLKRAGETVSRETLLHEVWGYNPEITTHTLETHIYRLRQKIEGDDGAAQIVITENGGYRLAN